jgi:hypothetical protein
MSSQIDEPQGLAMQITAAGSTEVPAYLVLIVTPKIGTAIVPHDPPVRESKDGRIHVCIHDVRVVCLFIPPPT